MWCILLFSSKFFWTKKKPSFRFCGFKSITVSIFLIEGWKDMTAWKIIASTWTSAVIIVSSRSTPLYLRKVLIALRAGLFQSKLFTLSFLASIWPSRIWDSKKIYRNEARSHPHVAGSRLLHSADNFFLMSFSFREFYRLPCPRRFLFYSLQKYVSILTSKKESLADFFEHSEYVALLFDRTQ